MAALQHNVHVSSNFLRAGFNPSLCRRVFFAKNFSHVEYCWLEAITSAIEYCSSFSWKFMESIKSLQQIFRKLLHISEMFGLVVIAIATTYAMAREAWAMAFLEQVTLTDLLLMFLFLEILVMVNQYFKAGQLPVRFPLYIAIVSLARELILNIERINEWHMLSSAAAILLLALGVLVIRFGQTKYPSNEDSEKEEGTVMR